MHKQILYHLYMSIFKFLSFTSIPKFYLLHYTHQNNKIYDFVNIHNKYICKLNDTKLKYYSYVTKLHIFINVHNIKHFTNLKYLRISDINSIFNHFKNTNNFHLNKYNKFKTINKDHLIFYNISVLYAKMCKKINKQLHKLTKLTKLHVSDNNNIYNINKLYKLKHLTLSNNDIITDKTFKYLVNLTDLCINNCQNVHNLQHLSKLQLLFAGKCVKLYKISPNLTQLYVDDNPYINDINYLTKLISLFATNNSGIDNNGIKNLINLKYLYAYNNFKISINSNINYLVIP